MEMPADYFCSDCRAFGVRLYRQYQTFLDRIRLLCTACELRLQWPLKPDSPHSIGWAVAAVPAPGGTYWGYTSIPDEALKWWESLPLEPVG